MSATQASTAQGPFIEPFEHAGQPALRLRTREGARAVVLLHGAHVVSWEPAASATVTGGERLYLSPLAAYAPGQAVRGGVPVIFPQFEKRGPLPRHGLARTRAWTLAEQQGDGEHATVVLRLGDDEDTRSHWPYRFAAELTVSLGAVSLDLELCARNTGESPFSFTAALHTYLRVQDIEAARLAGLAGLSYLDSTTGTEHIETAHALAVGGEIDRIYFGARQPLRLREPDRRLEIASQGFDDVVIWNPGPTKCEALADMPPDGWREMLCVEAACIGEPIALAPDEEWVGRQSLTAEA